MIRLLTTSCTCVTDNRALGCVLTVQETWMMHSLLQAHLKKFQCMSSCIILSITGFFLDPIPAAHRREEVSDYTGLCFTSLRNQNIKKYMLNRYFKGPWAISPLTGDDFTYSGSFSHL